MPNEVLIFYNTAVSILKMMDAFNESINLNKIASNSVEHILGLLIIISRKKHIYDEINWNN